MSHTPIDGSSTRLFSQYAFSALLMTLAPSQVAALFDPEFNQPWKHRMALYRRLQQLRQEGEDVARVVRPLVDSLEEDAVHPASVRGAADVGLRELVALLPRAEAIARSCNYLSHRRKTRRNAGRRILIIVEAKEACEAMLQIGIERADAAIVSSALRLGAAPAAPTRCYSLSAMVLRHPAL